MINEISLFANAKLNLSLDITGVRESDGYHLMDMVNCSIDLSDEITVRRVRGEGIEIRSNARFIPKNEKNLAYKAAVKFAEHVGIKIPGLEISIKKRIPMQAGLGGGSADAAAVLTGLNELLNTGMNRYELCAIGEKIGSDVPYCTVGGFARVTGIGELIEAVPNSCDFAMGVLMPRSGHSTREAFAAFDCGADIEHPQTELLLCALKEGDVSKLAMLTRNAFSEPIKGETTARLEAMLMKNGALGASMSGSGAAVFGVFHDRLTAQRCKERLWRRDFSAFVAVPTDSGVSIIKKR
ncbi:MAG: 4-(cytidine 5'-diphospho)-2-C-methyl-D-erythritol kinase [Oscillospiraceae bacterium]